MNDIDDIIAAAVPPTTHDTRLLDLQALTRAWINERSAPDLLPYPDAMMQRVMYAVRSQIEAIESLAGTMDPSSNFRLVVMQSELERYRFLLRSLLRARIAKLDRYPQHFRLKSSPDLLSSLEKQYLDTHAMLLSSHYNAAFLSSLPSNLQSLEDTTGGVSMVDGPDQQAAVFVRVLHDCGQLEVQTEQGSNAVELRRGDIWVLRWESVKEHVEAGDVELL